MPEMTPLLPVVLTPKQVAEMLQVAPSWVYEMTRERARVRNCDPLPHVRMGKYLRFHRADIEAWLERHKRAALKLAA